MRKLFVALASLAVVVGCAHTQQRSKYDVWTPPQTSNDVAQLPRLAADLKLDGNLDEWASAVVIPIHAKAQILEIAPTHQWKGEADLSADFLCGWTDNGLAIAGFVSDDQVMNNKPAADSWQQDCVELFVDGRSKGFMSADYGTGVYQLFVRPPLGGRPAEVISAHGEQIPVQIASKTRTGGWSFELVIPWSAFGKRPAKVALACRVDDTDAYDNGQRGITFAVPTRGDLYKNPAGFIPFKLVDAPKPGGYAGPSILIEAPAIIAAQGPEKINVLLAGDIAAKAREVRLSTCPVNLPTQPRWQLKAAPNEIKGRDSVAVGMVDFTVDPKATWPIGYGMLRAEAFDEKGQSMGYSQQPIIYVGDTVNRLTTEISNARIGDLAQKDPYRAAAWVGAAASVDRLKQCVDRGNAADVGWRLLEADSRIRILKGERAIVSRDYLHDLLILGADPEAEVAIEYPDATKCSITYNWGAIPLGSVVVRQFPSADAAIQELNNSFPGVFSQPTQFFRQPNAICNTVIQSEPATPAEIDLHEEALIWFPHQNLLHAVSPDQLDLIRYEALLKLPGGHSKPATAISIRQQEHPVPIVSLDGARRLDTVLIMGDPRSEKAFASAKYGRMIPRKGATTIVVAEGDRLYRATAPSEPSAFSMLHYALGNGPVSVSQVDTLRKRVLKAIAPDIKPDTGKTKIANSLYCGDLHMHTFYSDGNCSPAALMLEAIYAQQDFSVMTDHNTIAGALRAKALLASSGFHYDQIVGEEFTTNYHANIFPVSQAYKPPMEPQDLTRLMHESNIYVQWNHPGFPDWGHQYLVNGMQPLGFDAWEHLPMRYDQWLASGSVPLITGTTDTHDGTFGEWPERTIIFSASPDAQSLADALRAKQAIAVLPDAGTLFVGPPKLVSKAQAALAEGDGLKKVHAQRLREALKSSHPADLLRASESSPLPSAPTVAK